MTRNTGFTHNSIGCQLGRWWTHEYLPRFCPKIYQLSTDLDSYFPLIEIPRTSVLRHLTDLDLEDPGATSSHTLLDLLEHCSTVSA